MNSAVIGKKRHDALVEDSYQPLINFNEALKGTSIPPLVSTPAPTFTCSVHALFAGVLTFLKVVLTPKYRLIHKMTPAEIDEFTQKRVNIKELRKYKEFEWQLESQENERKTTAQLAIPLVSSPKIEPPKIESSQINPTNQNDNNPIPRYNQNDNSPTAQIPKVPRPFLNNH